MTGYSFHPRRNEYPVTAFPHFQSALFFALSVTWLVTRPVGAGTLTNATVAEVVFLLMLVVYLPLALRRFYGQSWRWTAVKALAIVIVYRQLMGPRGRALGAGRDLGGVSRGLPARATAPAGL